MNGATVELKAWAQEINDFVPTMVSEEDRDKLARLCDIAKIRTGRNHTIEAARTGTNGWRAPWVAIGDLRDEKLRRAYAARTLSMAGLSHLILGVEPGTFRVRYLDGNPMNLLRSNLNVFGPPVRRVRAMKPRMGIVVAAPPQASMAAVNQATDCSLTVEARDVYVVRVGTHTEVFFAKQEAVNRFAELMIERVR